MMFSDASIEALSGNAIYEFPASVPVYRAMREYLTGFFESSTIRRIVKDGSEVEKSDLIWCILNEGWWLFGRVNPEVPVRWLALTKKMLELQIVPSNVFDYCEAIVGSFDLQRYQGCYRLPSDEFLTLSEDLPVVKQKLIDFPREELLPPIPESDWENQDCVPPL
ncbi:MAG: hypothetical protein EON60_12020 [Alphaproteobacteria bacterium]|nr:MAG: hypothetical protein EON60_12020 [Alphaproteobacteria bacterium]